MRAVEEKFEDVAFGHFGKLASDEALGFDKVAEGLAGVMVSYKGEVGSEGGGETGGFKFAGNGLKMFLL